MLEIVSSGEADEVEAREGRGYQEHLAGEKQSYQWVISRIKKKQLDLG